MAKLSNPTRAYSSIAEDAISGSSNWPPRSMSATCQRPVTIRLISRSGASAMRSGAVSLAVMRARARNRKRRSFADLGFHRIDVVGAHFADCRHLAVRDLPQPERAGDVAILIERDGADDALIADRLAVFDQTERLGELRLAGIDDFARLVGDLEDRVADGDRTLARRRGDREADDGASVIGAIGGGIGGIDIGDRLVIGVEIFGRRGRAGARRGAIGFVQILRAGAGNEVRTVHAVVKQEFSDAALRYPGPGDRRAVDRRRNQVKAIGIPRHR